MMSRSKKFVEAEDEESMVYKEQMGEKIGAEVKENDVKGKENQEKGKKIKPKVNEMKMKAKKTRNELKVLDSKTYRLKNEERMKNGGKPSRICSWKRLRSVRKPLDLDFLHGNNFFSPKTA